MESASTYPPKSSKLTTMLQKSKSAHSTIRISTNCYIKQFVIIEDRGCRKASLESYIVGGSIKSISSSNHHTFYIYSRFSIVVWFISIIFSLFGKIRAICVICVSKLLFLPLFCYMILKFLLCSTLLYLQFISNSSPIHLQFISNSELEMN